MQQLLKMFYGIQNIHYNSRLNSIIALKTKHENTREYNGWDILIPITIGAQQKPTIYDFNYRTVFVTL